MSSRFTERAFKKSFRDKCSIEQIKEWKKDRAKRWFWEGKQHLLLLKKIVKEAFAPKPAKKKVIET